MSEASHRSPGGNADENARERAEEDAEFERARALLERTVRFLSRCVEDPKAALESEDPRVLIQGLKALSAPAPAVDAELASEDEAGEPKAIPIRRRRSA